jgi:glycosyltransferase involved in cell wall biosynthesis
VSGAPVVAVCTNRRPEDVAEALAALARQVPHEQILLVTSGLTATAAAAHAAGAPGPLEQEPRPGLSLARNRALAWAAARGAAAIAFVDDDAVVDSGWWQALRRRWESVDERVAVIGGPIRPRWTVQPPPWISPPILPALTLLELGGDQLELDPAVTTVFGANISFAVGPLQGSGGFDPAFGHSGRRVFFSEEDQAQRALVARGFRVLYAPELGVQHVIPAERLTRRSFVRRRFAYGRALGTRGGRDAGAALRQLATSAPGALVALLTRDDKLFMERAVRAAENAGVLVGRAPRGRMGGAKASTSTPSSSR